MPGSDIVFLTNNVYVTGLVHLHYEGRKIV